MRFVHFDREHQRAVAEEFMRTHGYPVGLALVFSLFFVGVVSALEPGWRNDQQIVIDGQLRYYRYYVPENLSSDRPPVVFVLHGGTQSMRKIMPPFGGPAAEWPAVADRNGFVLMVPNGVNPASGDPFGDDQNWNDCRDNSPGVISGDDVAFLDALIDWSVEELGIDRTRVYFSGASNGGMMSLRMATERPERIAAVATFIANQPDGSECEEPARPVPILLVHGTEDPLLPYAGGEVTGVIGGVVRSAPDTVQLWREAAGLDGEAVMTTLPDLDPNDGSIIEVQRWSDVRSGHHVEWLRMVGGGHAMPGILNPLSALVELVVGRQNHDLEGAEAAWAFLSGFRSFSAVSDGQWVNADPTFRGQAQGLALDYLPSADLLFVAWFTYTNLPIDDASPGEVGASGQRWLTAQLAVHGQIASGPVFSSRGGRFDSPPTGFQTTEPVGHMTIEFLACNRAMVSYSLDDPPLARQFEIQPGEQSAVGAFTCAAALRPEFPGLPVNSVAN